jgi:hypothetical protein
MIFSLPSVGVLDYEGAAARIPSEQTAFAKCISHYESRGDYKATSPHSSASGKWQFLDKQWRRGLSFMVANRLVDYGMPAWQRKPLIKRLQSKPIESWSPIHQDIGFVAALNAREPWSGWRHWQINEDCVRLVPSNKK